MSWRLGGGQVVALKSVHSAGTSLDFRGNRCDNVPVDRCPVLKGFSLLQGHLCYISVERFRVGVCVLLSEASRTGRRAPSLFSLP